MQNHESYIEQEQKELWNMRVYISRLNIKYKGTTIYSQSTNNILFVD